MKMNDAVRRGIRTFVQTFVAMLLIVLVPFSQQVTAWAAGDGEFPGFTALGAGVVAALVAGVVALVSFVQNWLEDNTRWPNLLK